MIFLQLLLVILWHAIVFYTLPFAVELAADAMAPFWQTTGLDNRTLESLDASGTPVVLVWFAAREVSWPNLVLLEGLLAYFVYRRFVAPARASLELFARAWWRACLWGYVAIPVAVIVLAVLPITLFAGALCVAVPLYLIPGPALLARSELRAGVRRSRWQPVCPECGYSLRGLASLRCPECGETLPTTSRVYRRWAWRRLPWDRRARGGLLSAYVQSLLWIVFRPRRAARGLLLPDRYPRAARWGLTHLAVLAALRGGLVLGTLFLAPWQQRFVPTYFTFFVETPAHELSAGIMALWTAQTGAAWLAALGILPAIGVSLAATLPGWHPAARRSVAKWSLYAVVVAVLTQLAVLAGLAAWWSRRLRPMPWSEYAGAILGLADVHPPGLMLAVPYGVWWAAGVAANPYLRRRGMGALVGYAALFYGAWFMVARLAFPPGGLRGLL